MLEREEEEGWWLCKRLVDGAQGLVPSNYVELQNDVYDLPKKHFELDELYDQLPNRTPEEPYDILPSRRVEDVYDLPRASQPEEDYDTLPERAAYPQPDGVYDLPRNSNNNNMRKISEEIDDDYDLPRPFLSPKSSTSESKDDDYDELPKRKSTTKVEKSVMRNSVASSTASSTDTVSISSLQIDQAPLSMDYETAVEKLLKLKSEVDATVSKILTLFTNNWRAFAEKPPTQEEKDLVALYSKEMLQALRDFVDFGRATLATVLAANVICKKTTSVITRRLQPIEEDVKILEGTELRLVNAEWVS